MWTPCTVVVNPILPGILTSLFNVITYLSFDDNSDNDDDNDNDIGQMSVALIFFIEEL